MGLTYSGDVNTYKVWVRDEAEPIEVKAEQIREVGSFLVFMAQGSRVVLSIPVANVKSVRHSSLPDPVAKRATTS